MRVPVIVFEPRLLLQAPACNQGASKCTHDCALDQWGEGCLVDGEYKSCAHRHGGHAQCGKCMCVDPSGRRSNDNRESDLSAMTVDVARAWDLARIDYPIRRALFLRHALDCAEQEIADLLGVSKMAISFPTAQGWLRPACRLPGWGKAMMNNLGLPPDVIGHMAGLGGTNEPFLACHSCQRAIIYGALLHAGACGAALDAGDTVSARGHIQNVVQLMLEFVKLDFEATIGGNEGWPDEAWKIGVEAFYRSRCEHYTDPETGEVVFEPHDPDSDEPAGVTA